MHVLLEHSLKYLPLLANRVLLVNIKGLMVNQVVLIVILDL